jgi:hypothetical protein
VGALFVLTLASAMPAVPSTSYSCLLPALLGIPGGCAKSAFSFVGKTQSVSRLHGVRLQNALCACVATPLPRSFTLRSLCTLWTHPPPSHAVPASPRELFFLKFNAASGALMASAPSLPGNEPRIVAIQDMFPAVDLTTVNAIFHNKFEAENLLRLDASFLHKKKSHQFWAFNPAGYTGLSIAPAQKDVELKEYETLAVLMRPLEVYSQVLVQFSPESRKLSLSSALAVYRHRLYEFYQTHTWESIKLFHMAFHRKRILTGPYIPEGWSREDHGLETIYLHKRSPQDGKNRYEKRPYSGTGGTTGSSGSGAETGEICRRWNEDNCSHNPCRYRHACLQCDGSHPRSRCSGPGKRPTNSEPRPPARS